MAGHVTDLLPLHRADLMPTLIQVIEDPGANSEAHLRLIHDRTFEMLYEVLYELSTRLLSSGRRQFAEVAPRIFQTVAATYDNYTSNTISELIKGAMANLELELNIVSMCVKCLRILLVSGIHDVHKFDETKVLLLLFAYELVSNIASLDVHYHEQRAPRELHEDL